MQLHHTSRDWLYFHNPALEHRLSVNDPIKTRIKRRLNRFGGVEGGKNLPSPPRLRFLHLDGSCNLHSNKSFVSYLRLQGALMDFLLSIRMRDDIHAWFLACLRFFSFYRIFDINYYFYFYTFQKDYLIEIICVSEKFM